MTIRISVITCAHNPRLDYLTQVIDGLRNQTLDQSRWEYLLIDNASAELLEPRVDLSWHSTARHIREEQLGLTYARLRGIREAGGELVVFVDDDNVLDPDFLEQASKIADEWPMLGAWGGQSRPSFETPPEDWTRPYLSRLVIRQFVDDRWSNQSTATDTMPCGAGMCVRRRVADYYLRLHDAGHRPIVMDRKGSLLLAGGDTDIALCACDLRLGMGMFASLRLAHLIPPDRLTEDYLAEMLESLSYSAIVLNSFRSINGAPHPRKLSTRIADLGRLLLRDRRERRFFRAIRRGEERARKFLLNNQYTRRDNVVVCSEQSA